MRTVIFAAAVGAALSAVAWTGNDGPFKASQWTNGQYAQDYNGPVNVFPNPAANYVYLTYPGLSGEAVVSIIAEDGFIVKSMQVGQTTDTQTVMQINDLPNGLYFIRVEQPDGLNISRTLVVDNGSQSVSP